LQYCDCSLRLWLKTEDFAFACQDITLGLKQIADGLGLVLPKLEFHEVVSVGVLSKWRMVICSDADVPEGR